MCIVIQDITCRNAPSRVYEVFYFFYFLVIFHTKKRGRKKGRKGKRFTFWVTLEFISLGIYNCWEERMVFTHVVPRFLSLSQNRGAKFKKQIYNNLLEYFRFSQEGLNFQTILYCTAQLARTTQIKKTRLVRLKEVWHEIFRLLLLRFRFHKRHLTTGNPTRPTHVTQRSDDHSPNHLGCGWLSSVTDFLFTYLPLSKN